MIIVTCKRTVLKAQGLCIIGEHYIDEVITPVMLSEAKHLGKMGTPHPRPFARRVGTQGDNAKTLAQGAA